MKKLIIAGMLLMSLSTVVMAGELSADERAEQEQIIRIEQLDKHINIGKDQAEHRGHVIYSVLTIALLLAVALRVSDFDAIRAKIAEKNS